MIFIDSELVVYREVKLIKQPLQFQGNVQTQKNELLTFIKRNEGLQDLYNTYKESEEGWRLLLLEGQKLYKETQTLENKNLVSAVQVKLEVAHRKATLVSYDLVGDLPNAVVKWDKAALAKLATNVNGVRAFENLRNIMDVANGNTSAKTAAQHILLDLTKNAQGKNDYARLQQLYLDLKDVTEHTENIRAGLLLQADDLKKKSKSTVPKH